MKIYILATNKRLHILEKTKDFWESHGWEVEIEFNDNQHPSVGRNRILKKFYSSNEPWLAMCDDDTILDINKGQTQQFLQDPFAVLDCIPEYVSLVAPMNPSVLMVSATHKQPIYKTHWRLERENSITGKLIFFKKLKQEFYQRIDLPAWEDVEWGYQQIVAGYMPCRLNNIVLKESGKSSLFLNQEERNKAYKVSKEKIAQIYPEIYFNNRGEFIRRDLVKKYLGKYPRFFDWGFDFSIQGELFPNNFEDLFQECH